MDPDTLVAGLQRSREQMRTVLMAGKPGFEQADVFPRSRTMRFLMDPARRGIASTLLGTLASVFFGGMRRKRRRTAIADTLLRTLGLRR